jgi:hypothetical protein
MITLRSLSENIAYKLGDQFNYTLRQSIIIDIIHWRAVLIRRDLERNPLSYNGFINSICVQLEEADKSYCSGLPSKCTVMKSKEKIARPLRLKSNGRTNFFFVGDVHKSTSYVFANQNEIVYNCHLEFQDEVIYYGFKNDYLVVYNNPLQCKVLLEYIVDDPRDIESCDYPDILAEDLEFNLSSDLASEISSIIYRERRPTVIKDGEEVQIENDSRP